MESEDYLQASRAPLLQGVMWTMAIVPLVFVLMRLYVRAVLKRVFGWDDFIIIIATVSLHSLLLLALIFLGGSYYPSGRVAWSLMLPYVTLRPR